MRSHVAGANASHEGGRPVVVNVPLHPVLLLRGAVRSDLVKLRSYLRDDFRVLVGNVVGLGGVGGDVEQKHR